MATEAFKSVIGIIGNYVHPMKAQVILENFCSSSELSCDEFSPGDLPQFILFLAKERDNVCTLDDKKFFVMISSLVSYSNSFEQSGVMGR